MKTIFGQKYPILSKTNQENIEKCYNFLRKYFTHVLRCVSDVFSRVRCESSVTADTTNSDPPLAFPPASHRSPTKTSVPYIFGN